MILAGAVGFTVAGLILGGWLLWLTWRVQLVLTHAEQTLAAATALLALAPGKSAPPTDTPPDAQPHRWWQRLRDLTVPDDGPDVPDEPPTAPQEAVIDTWHRGLTTDPVDAALARFSYVTGHRSPASEDRP